MKPRPFLLLFLALAAAQPERVHADPPAVPGGNEATEQSRLSAYDGRIRLGWELELIPSQLVPIIDFFRFTIDVKSRAEAKVQDLQTKVSKGHRLDDPDVEALAGLEAVAQNYILDDRTLDALPSPLRDQLIERARFRERLLPRGRVSDSSGLPSFDALNSVWNELPLKERWSAIQIDHLGREARAWLAIYFSGKKYSDPIIEVKKDASGSIPEFLRGLQLVRDGFTMEFRPNEPQAPSGFYASLRAFARKVGLWDQVRDQSVRGAEDVSLHIHISLKNPAPDQDLTPIVRELANWITLERLAKGKTKAIETNGLGTYSTDLWARGVVRMLSDTHFEIREQEGVRMDLLEHILRLINADPAAALKELRGRVSELLARPGMIELISTHGTPQAISGLLAGLGKEERERILRERVDTLIAADRERISDSQIQSMTLEQLLQKAKWSGELLAEAYVRKKMGQVEAELFGRPPPSSERAGVLWGDVSELLGSEARQNFRLFPWDLFQGFLLPERIQVTLSHLGFSDIKALCDGVSERTGKELIALKLETLRAKPGQPFGDPDRVLSDLYRAYLDQVMTKEETLDVAAGLLSQHPEELKAVVKMHLFAPSDLPELLSKINPLPRDALIRQAVAMIGARDTDMIEEGVRVLHEVASDRFAASKKAWGSQEPEMIAAEVRMLDQLMSGEFWRNLSSYLDKPVLLEFLNEYFGVAGGKDQFYKELLSRLGNENLQPLRDRVPEVFKFLPPDSDKSRQLATAIQAKLDQYQRRERSRAAMSDRERALGLCELKGIEARMNGE